MTQRDAWTVGRLLAWTTDYLGQQGAESPRLDAEVLLAHARSCRRIDLYAAYGDLASDEVRAAYRELVRRRVEGTPVAYLVESREFYSLPFRVTPAVLIPRPETEFLLIRLLDLAKLLGLGRDQPTTIVDVGTGSGVLAICAAVHLPASQVTAVDLQEDALCVARENAAAHSVEDRIQFINSDLLEGVPAEKSLDFVVSNPPYVSREEYHELPSHIRDQEPRAALLAGETGTEVIERLISQAAERLKSGGWLLTEVSPMIADKVRDMLQADERYTDAAVTRDLAKLPRVVEARVR